MFSVWGQSVEKNEQVIVEALYLDLEEQVKQSKSDGDGVGDGEGGGGGGGGGTNRECYSLHNRAYWVHQPPPTPHPLRHLPNPSEPSLFFGLQS